MQAYRANITAADDFIYLHRALHSVILIMRNCFSFYDLNVNLPFGRGLCCRRYRLCSRGNIRIWRRCRIFYVKTERTLLAAAAAGCYSPFAGATPDPPAVSYAARQ